MSKMYKCAQCKKEFYVSDPDQYVYKYKLKRLTKYTCSWTCFSAYKYGKKGQKVMT